MNFLYIPKIRKNNKKIKTTFKTAKKRENTKSFNVLISYTKQSSAV